VAEENSIIEGVLGGEGEPGGHGAAPNADPLAGIDPIAAALAVHAARSGQPLDPHLKSYLKRQERLAESQAKLVEIQTEHMHEQREAQLGGLRLRNAIDRLKLGLNLFAAVGATVVGVGVLVMLHDAFTSHAVVIDAFKAPSALAPRGLTGEVIAADILDALQKMQHATHAIEKQQDARGAWASDIKIEVPDTGVSIGEVDRLLHQRFGHDLHIDGELVQTETGGLALTVRGDGAPGATFAGGPGDLEKLTTQAAEYVYGRSQAQRFAAYLVSAGRFADAVGFIQDAFPRAKTDAERAQLANTWGNAYILQNQPRPAAEKYRLSMSLLKPRTKGWWKAWINLTNSTEASLGEEAGWREAHAFLQAAAAAPKGEQPELRVMGAPASVTWDFPLGLASLQQDATLNGGAGASATPNGPAFADVYALMHDQDRAARYLASSDPDDPLTKAEALLLPGYAALDRGDARSAAGPLDALYKMWLADPRLQVADNYAPCFAGLADGLDGRVKDAEAIFARIPGESLCVAMHGDVLAHAGDEAGAQRVWAEGRKAFPDLPTIPLHRGLYFLGKGDLMAAEADLSLAAAKGPHWADPWKAWGDVLAREGRWKEAVARYDEARKHAPAWKELLQARDAAARQVR
jgi:tetratricopeptide (TPR) repeat protein